MKTPILATIAGAFALAAPAAAGDGKKKDAQPKVAVAWARSFDDAVQEASERNLPILVHSYAAT